MQSRKLKRKKMMEELTRQDILDSSVAVLLESGINGFTMDDVAGKAGIAKGTVYLYFKNKQTLLNSVVYYSFEPLEEKLETIAHSDIDPFSKLEKCARVALGHTEKNKPLLNELRSVMFNTIDQDISDRKSWYWKVIDLFKSVLDDGIKTGKLRQMNTAKLATLFLESIDCLMLHRILSTVTETIEEDVHELMNLYANGLSLIPVSLKKETY